MNEPPSLFAELKRRRVFRVAAIYVVGAVACVEAVDVFSDALSLPDWTLLLAAVLAVAGLPVAVALGWVFDLTSKGFRRTPASGAEPAGTGERPVLLSAALAALLLSAAGAGWVVARATGPAAPQRRAVAVLPIENQGTAPEDAFFASGIHDEIITRLAGVRDLKVISRTSVLAYEGVRRNLREIARELDVTHVVEGSAQRVGSRVRVRVQLIDAATDEHVWAESYEAELSDVFAVQGEIATRIAGALDVRMSREERGRIDRPGPASGEAYALYLRARDRWFRSAGVESELHAAAELYRRTLELDSTFAAARAGLSWVYSRLYWLGHDRSEARIQLARIEAERAIALAPDLPEPHVAMGIYWYYSGREYGRALEELRLATEMAPSASDAHLFSGFIHRRLGDWRAAVEAMRRALELDPRNPALPFRLGESYTMLRRWQAAERMSARAVELAPDNPVYALQRGKLFLRWTGTTDSLRAALERLRASGRDGDTGLTRYELALFERRLDQALRAVADLPRVVEDNLRLAPRPLLEGLARRWLSGEEARALFAEAASEAEAAVAERPADPLPLVALAFAHAGLGRRDEAARGVERVLRDVFPERRDVLLWRYLASDAALALVLAGEHERALDLLETLLTTPSPLSAGLLRLHPGWDPLRGHPRFQALLATQEVVG